MTLFLYPCITEAPSVVIPRAHKRGRGHAQRVTRHDTAKFKTGRQDVLNLDYLYTCRVMRMDRPMQRANVKCGVRANINKLLFIDPVLNFAVCTRCMPSSPFMSPWLYILACPLVSQVTLIRSLKDRGFLGCKQC